MELNRVVEGWTKSCQPFRLIPKGGSIKSEIKKRFIIFLKNLCNQGWDDESWQEYAVNHYTDPTLEKIRQMVVEIGIEDERFQNTGKLNENSKEKIQKIMSDKFGK